jgi:hypothetical protein
MVPQGGVDDAEVVGGKFRQFAEAYPIAALAGGALAAVLGLVCYSMAERLIVPGAGEVWTRWDRHRRNRKK